jgi:hypothetical protein
MRKKLPQEIEDRHAGKNLGCIEGLTHNQRLQGGQLEAREVQGKIHRRWETFNVPVELRKISLTMWHK